jgi:PAS domain S-box-containing protein
VSAVIQVIQRKKAEQKREQIEKALQDSEESYRSFYENSLDGILLTTPDGTILSANPQACRMFGMTEDEIIGAGIEGLVVKDEKLAAMLEDKELTGRMRSELTYRRKDRSTFVGEVTSHLFVDSDGDIKSSIIFRDVTANKCAVEAFCQSDQRIRFKLDTNLSPAREIADLELSDIVDVQAIQFLMDDFYELAHIPMFLLDLKGNVLVGVGWQDICTKFHRVNPETCRHCFESDTELFTGITPGEFKLYKCKNNMWDVATPLTVGGKHVGNIFSGQFFFKDEPLDYEFFRSQTRKYGFNEEEYIAALEKVPRLSRETIDTAMAFLVKLANMISQPSYRNIKLVLSLAERDALMSALCESEKRERARSDELETVLDTVPVAVYIAHDPQALQITGNRLSYEWLRIPVGTNFSKSAPKGERPETFNLLKDGAEIPPVNMPSQMAAAGRDVNNCELDIVSADGNIRHVLGNARPLRDEQGNLRGSVSAFIDITERKEAETKLNETMENLEHLVNERTSELEKAYYLLKENEKGLAEAQKMAHIGNWDWNLTTGEMYWSDELYSIFGRNPHDPAPSGNEFLNYIHPKDRDYVNNAIMEGLNRKPYSIECCIILDNGEERTVYALAEVICNENHNPIRVKGIVQDITERKITEKRIQTLANAVESSDDAIVTQSLEGVITSWNTGAEQLYGYTAEEVLGINVSIIEPDYLKGEIKRLIEKIKQGEKNQRYETSRLKKDGTIINVSATLSPVFNSSGELVAISTIARDITKRVKAEKALAKIEDARKKEIHHRIKNNLQVISSLLDLQAEKIIHKKTIPVPEILEAFRESQGRVISMSLIHEELYKGNGVDILDFSTYLEKLTENLFQTYSVKSRNIRLYMDLEKNAFFDMDTAVPLGIIVNELVSNSLKHAFTENQEGEIRIRLSREGQEEKNDGMHKSIFSLTISDNGKGIPEGFEFEKPESLGLQLVNTLVDQLDGTVVIKREQGTELRIKFNVVDRL